MDLHLHQMGHVLLTFIDQVIDAMLCLDALCNTSSQIQASRLHDLHTLDAPTTHSTSQTIVPIPFNSNSKHDAGTDRREEKEGNGKDSPHLTLHACSLCVTLFHH